MKPLGRLGSSCSADKIPVGCLLALLMAWVSPQGRVTPPTTPYKQTIQVLPSVSGAMALDPETQRIFVVNPDSGSVSVVDAHVEEKIAEISVGSDPRELVLDQETKRLFVTCQGSNVLAVVDVNDLSLVGITNVGAEPYGIAFDSTRGLIYVASSAEAVVEVIAAALPQANLPDDRAPEIGRNERRATSPAEVDFENRHQALSSDNVLRIVGRIRVGFKPKGLALSADGTRLYVTHFLSGEMSVIDTSERRVLQVISTGNDSNLAQKITLHPTNNRAYLPHIRSNVTNRNLLFDSTVFPVISVIDLASNQALPRERLDLSLGDVSVNLPFDVDFSSTGQHLYVASLGSGDVAVMDLTTGRRVARIEVGDGPRGIIVSADGRKAYVANSLSDDLSVIDLINLREVKRIPVTNSPLPSEIKRGKVLFFSSRSRELARDQWMSCASCHFDGEQDGRTWFFPPGPRNTPSLRGAGETRPLHWSSDRDEVQDFEFTIRRLQAGSGLIRGTPHPELGPPNAGLSADLDALAAFVESLRPKPSPFNPAEGALKEAIERGRAVFERPDVGCTDCHPSPRFTDSTLSLPFIRHDVGTGDSPDERMGSAFDTPSLRGLWDSAPYLHDGSAQTLHDVLITRNPRDRHGRTSHLSEEEIRDLITFLSSL